jgi:hypothetical protein
MIVGTPKELAPKLLELDQTKKYELKEQKSKRTPKQNDYYHSLKNQLATKMRKSPDEIHFEMIKKSCPFSEFLVPYEADLRAIQYYTEGSKIERGGKLYKVLRVYVGSIQLSCSEMCILLDNMIEECQLQGIETKTPDEIAKMRALEKQLEEMGK